MINQYSMLLGFIGMSLCLYAGASEISEKNKATETEKIILNVNPKICLTGKQQACDLNLTVDWQSEIDYSICLFIETQHEAIECWTQQNSGFQQLQQSITQSLTVWLAENKDAKRLAQAVVQVVHKVISQRKFERRRRHSWSFF